jgi:hypothetical protein
MVMDAVNKGLLQVYRIAPNSKQDGAFQMCENANQFNNMISGNNKIAKALDIEVDLGINCLMYCKHRLNLRHKKNKNNFKKRFQWEIACTTVAAHNTHKMKQAGQVQKDRIGAMCFVDALGYIKKVGKGEE